MTYEEFEEAKLKIKDSIFKEISKEEYDRIEERLKKEEEFEKEIDLLAEEYMSRINNVKIEYPKELKLDVLGYYVILEYCLKRIKLEDSNMKLYGNCCAEFGLGWKNE